MEDTKGASLERFIKVASALDGDTLITPEIYAELVAMAARLDEIQLEAKMRGVKIKTDSTMEPNDWRLGKI